jgi:outer membrane protein
MRTVLTFLNFLLILGVIGYIFYKEKRKPSVYILTQEVFRNFEGKQELEKKLNNIKSLHKKQLDSVALLIENQRATHLASSLRDMQENFSLTEQHLSGQYTADIWQRINLYLADFAKVNHHDFIFGAAGEGNLMFAHEALDVTKEAVEYINKRYKEGE